MTCYPFPEFYFIFLKLDLLFYVFPLRMSKFLYVNARARVLCLG